MNTFFKATLGCLFGAVRPLALQLADYERSGASLEAYMPTLLAALDTLDPSKLGPTPQ